MASIAEQIVETVRTALYNTIPAVGTRVWRAREDALERNECPAIVIASTGETVDIAEADAEVDACVLTVEVAIHVAGGEASPWETVADAVVVSAHGLIRAATYPGTAGPPQRVARSWSAVSGDASPGICVLVYRFDYWSTTADLSVAA